MRSRRADRLYLGWQYATLYPEPGPPPRRPTPPEQERLNPDWATAQRREESMLNRPLKVAFGVAGLAGLVVVVLGVAGLLNVLVAGLAVICCALVAAVCGHGIWQGERALRSRLADERIRVDKIGRPRKASSSPGRPNTRTGSSSGRHCATPMSIRSGGMRSARPRAFTG